MYIFLYKEILMERSYANIYCKQIHNKYLLLNLAFIVLFILSPKLLSSRQVCYLKLPFGLF